ARRNAPRAACRRAASGTDVNREADALSSWLVQHAYPCWWSRGVDHVRGGFHESLQLDGEPSGETRRARLYPRQIYAFSVAAELGSSGVALRRVVTSMAARGAKRGARVCILARSTRSRSPPSSVGRDLRQRRF